MTFIHINPFVNKKAEEVIHLIQETERKEMDPKNKWDIRGRMQDVANHERYKFDAAQDINWIYRWEQIENALKREKGHITADKVLLWMYKLEHGECIKVWKGQSESERKRHAEMMILKKGMHV
jgi:hypothetical protein